MSQLASPAAVRLSLPRWIDLRVGFGLLLVCVSVAVGARVFATADDTTPVWAAARPLVPGEHVVAADLRVAHVRFDTAGSAYVGTATLPVGYVVTRPVSAGELVPAAALRRPGTPPATRLVTVPVDPGHLPDDVGRGSVVDVYVTPRSSDGTAAPRLVLAGAAVESRAGGSRTFGGTSTVAVELSVPADAAARVVAAVEQGAVDLAVVPAVERG